MTALVYAFPQEAYREIDKVPVKFLLATLCWLLVTAIALIIWFLRHLPRAPLLVMGTRRIIIAVGIPATGATFVGWPKLNSFKIVSGEVFPNVDFNLIDIAIGTGPVFLIFVSALIIITRYYVEILKYEAVHGPLQPRT